MSDSTPSDYRAVLLSKAFATGHGPEYNRTSWELRQEHEWLFYEVVLREGQSWEDMKQEVFEPLGRYLGFKKLADSFGSGLVVTLFQGEHFYLITGPDFLGAYCELEGLPLEGLGEQLREWIVLETPVYPLMHTKSDSR